MKGRKIRKAKEASKASYSYLSNVCRSFLILFHPLCPISQALHPISDRPLSLFPPPSSSNNFHRPPERERKSKAQRT
ncbi:hypothetical protein IE53DRAFT_391251 [Violaceomyces palustris]|uniref:Uncharacterized protein n=1 Tax=Violaceomyces palustris TaxID=1673888 RepID=A0ACD0NL70_9BASI|nr:hypothetical protein IE53DRAFT_391251 [Violaceomyces palustris]